ncbi:MAG: DUF3305 domain-containing protein [Wenzhouxiangellaceae bacterium]|nr:DUF3305 domain-containing protein [Wenzhouxiangellaceae bacterium]
MDKHARVSLSVMMQHDHRGWHCVGAVPEPGAPPEQPTRSLVRDGQDAQLYRWQGLTLSLRQDACDDYWFNLTSRQPLLFILCQPGADGEPMPHRVTADQDEGVAAQEVDEILFQTAMPASIVIWIKNYVATHWRPGPRKQKRRRRGAEKAERAE